MKSKKPKKRARLCGCKLRKALAKVQAAERRQQAVFWSLSKQVWDYEPFSVERAMAAIKSHNARGELLGLRLEKAMLRQLLKAGCS